jgi:hypothetical protein
MAWIGEGWTGKWRTGFQDCVTLPGIPPFTVSNPTEFRDILLTQTCCNLRRTDTLELSDAEFFETLSEEVPLLRSVSVKTRSPRAIHGATPRVPMLPLGLVGLRGLSLP